MKIWYITDFEVLEAYLEAHEKIPISFWDNDKKSASGVLRDPRRPAKVKNGLFSLAKEHLTTVSNAVKPVKDCLEK